MAFIRQARLRKFAEVAAELAESPGERVSPSNFLLGADARLIPVDRVSYNEVDRCGGRLVTAHSLNEAPDPALIAGMNRHIHEHPGFARADPVDPWPAPTQLSDFLTQRQFRQLGLYQDHFRLYGIHYQLGVSFAVSPARRISFGLNRVSRDFTSEDRILIDMVRWQLAAAWRRMQAEAELAAVTAMRDAAFAGPAAAMLLNAQGKRLFCNEAAAMLMARYDASAVLMAWAKQQAVAAEAGDKQRAKTVVKRENGHLLAAFVPAPRPRGLHLLKLSERPAAPSARPLESLGLGRREAETLFWLSRGKRNAEIAVICGVHVTTVSTHLRAVFAKLGVETRTAAAAMAWETLMDAANEQG
jgi:DNA-binding CsgD family transcriptional regulator